MINRSKQLTIMSFILHYSELVGRIKILAVSKFFEK